MIKDIPCFAAIDLGTNSCRLLICDREGNRLCAETVPTRLGEGMYKEMMFTPEAVERGLKCFYDYRQIMDRYNIQKCRAIATASCRMAANGEEFVKKVYAESRIKLEVVDGAEEARLNLKGAAEHVRGRRKYVVVYDLGGGSTEITLALNEANPQIIHTVSIPWGARNASEAFELVEYPGENQLRLEQEIEKYVKAFVEKSGLKDLKGQVEFVATSSTPLRLVSMIRDFGRYDRDLADGQQMMRTETDAAIARILNMSREEMAGNPYIGDKRSYIFIAACVIFKTIYDGLEADKITASLKSAKDGIIAELIEEEKQHG